MNENKRHEKVVSSSSLTVETLRLDKNTTSLGYTAFSLGHSIWIAPALLRNRQFALVHIYQLARSRRYAAAEGSTEYQSQLDHKIICRLETIISLKLYRPRSWSEYSASTDNVVGPYIPAHLSVQFGRY